MKSASDLIIQGIIPGVLRRIQDDGYWKTASAIIYVIPGALQHLR